jgi:ferredoxin
VKILVDADRCVGHARCEAIAPAVYRTNPDDGFALPVEGVVPAEREAEALRGARACPERAIKVLGGADHSEILWPPPKPGIGQ